MHVLDDAVGLHNHGRFGDGDLRLVPLAVQRSRRHFLRVALAHHPDQRHQEVGLAVPESTTRILHPYERTGNIGCICFCKQRKTNTQVVLCVGRRCCNVRLVPRRALREHDTIR